MSSYCRAVLASALIAAAALMVGVAAVVYYGSLVEHNSAIRLLVSQSSSSTGLYDFPHAQENRLTAHAERELFVFSRLVVNDIHWTQKLTRDQTSAVLHGDHLRQLTLVGTDLSREHLLQLARHSKLKHVVIAECEVDGALTDLLVTERIETCGIGNVTFAGELSGHDEAHLPDLTRLVVNEMHVDVDFLRVFSGAPRLASVALINCVIHDGCFSKLSDMRSVSRVDVSHSDFDARELAALKANENLTHIFLSFTKVTASDVAFMSDMPNLKGVNFAGCQNLASED